MRAQVLIALCTLPLTGCYNLLIVNVGVGNKSAAALAAEMTPEAFCSALENQTFEFRRDNERLTQEATKMCADLQQKKKTPKEVP